MFIRLYLHTFLLTMMMIATGTSFAINNQSTSEKSSVNSVKNNSQHKLQGLRSDIYQTREEIDELAIKLRQHGFETKIMQLKQGYIVNAGAFSSKSNLERALNRLNKAGLGKKIHVVKMGQKQSQTYLSTNHKTKRSAVFSSHTTNIPDKGIMDEYVPKKDYVELKQEVGALKAQMQQLLEKLALTEQDLNTKEHPQEKTKKPESQIIAKSSQTKESEPAKVKPERDNDPIEDDKEITREDEAEEAKRGLDTFLRGKKVMYRPGELEVELGLSYGQGTTVNTFGLSNNKELNTTAKLTTRSVDAGFTLRYGIVDDLEFDLSVPYGYFEQNNDDQPFNVETVEDSVCPEEEEDPNCAEGLPKVTKNTAPVSHTNAAGIGDISGSLNYNLFSEKGNFPTVTLSLSGQAPTGNYNKGLGAGFWGIGGGISLVKTIDPVVFFGSVGYSASFEERGIVPSGTTSYSIGAGYSMNDRVSFSTSLSGTLTGRTERNGVKIPGSSMDSHSLLLSTTIQLSKHLSVEPYVGFGLTEDASDFAVGLKFPYRFGERFRLPFLPD